MIMALRQGVSRNRMWSLATVAAAMLSVSCVAEVSDQSEEDSVAAQASELKNGTQIYGTGASRGSVAIRFWSPLWQEWQVCSGQVVSKRTILTAAHCVIRASQTAGGFSGTAQVIVWRASTVSSHDLVLSQTTVQARYNPDYDNHVSEAAYDVGLFISPVDLPNFTSADAARLAKTTPSNVSMQAIGYGIYDEGAQYDDGIGRSGSISPTYLTKALEYYYQSTAAQPYICKQDSGGPLKRTANGVLQVFGVASRHDGPGTYCRPNGHWATTAGNIGWLRNNVSGNCTENANYVSCW
jgi:V8-like Glu-specific endopeptidase